jgi:hypothetical protein
MGFIPYMQMPATAGLYDRALMYMHIVAQYHLSAGFVLIYGDPVANKAMPP